jgi:hypothetical protein
MEGSSHGLIYSIIQEFFWKDWRKTWETSASIGSCQNEIQTWNLQNTKKRAEDSAKMLGKVREKH